MQTALRKAARWTTYTIPTAHSRRTRRFNQRSISTHHYSVRRTTSTAITGDADEILLTTIGALAERKELDIIQTSNDASQFQLSRERMWSKEIRCTHGGSREFYKAAAQQRGAYIWAMILTHPQQRLQWQERSESEPYR
ncbi:PREDICTED: uncharacterized protein LOC105150208 [Acromyrmex echinatior]|uniref:Uncharacterized protein n=1 Tax=Acromyrmex echinatior TaxID=103372 RepID=F4WX60_ACREC|nr:PREDICTED: uncharacterized protein LOC105150208 [Acromyrmex echinatior]XP_011061430.1 PREDICTED: uncharacterized protein LOC105150208 [Acromyrmex echinatior]EGI61303.1 hypothetical protein G5I_10551 [Acromyrmex echinatior]